MNKHHQPRFSLHSGLCNCKAVFELFPRPADNHVTFKGPLPNIHHRFIRVGNPGCFNIERAHNVGVLALNLNISRMLDTFNSHVFDDCLFGSARPCCKNHG